MVTLQVVKQTSGNALVSVEQIKRKIYNSPQLVEWGAIEVLTMGSKGGEHDDGFTGTNPT